jgi:hypothetical protein
MNTETKMEAEMIVEATEEEREVLRRIGVEREFDEGNADDRQRILTVIRLAPQDEQETMLVTQLTVAFRAACECYRGGIAAGVTYDGFNYLKMADRLSRTFVLMLGALDRHREKAPIIDRNRLMRADLEAERKKKSAKQPSAPSRVPDVKSAKQPCAAPSPVPDVKSAKQPSRPPSPPPQEKFAKQPSGAEAPGAQAPGAQAPVPTAKSAKQPSVAPSLAPASAPPSRNADSAKQPPTMTLARAYELMGPGEPDPTTRGRRMIYTVPPEHRDEILAVFAEERKSRARSNGDRSDVHDPILRCP